MSLHKIQINFTFLFIVFGILSFIGFVGASTGFADTVPLSDRSKGLDANGNGLVDRD